MFLCLSLLSNAASVLKSCCLWYSSTAAAVMLASHLLERGVQLSSVNGSSGSTTGQLQHYVPVVGCARERYAVVAWA